MSSKTVQSIHLIQKCMEINERNSTTFIKLEITSTNGLIMRVLSGGKARTFLRQSSGQESEEVFNGDAVVNQPCDILAELEKLEGKNGN